MRLSRSALIALPAVASWAVAIRAQAAAAPGSVRLEHVTVVDVRRGRLLRDRTVTIEGGRIAAVQERGAAPAPASAPAEVRAGTRVRVLDAAGGYLIPGLWDMHVHAQPWGESALALFVATGVTGIRDMGGHLDVLAGWRADVAAGRRVGPRIVAAGPILDGIVEPENYPAEMRSRIPLTDSATARRVVDSLSRAGVDFLKVYNILPRAAYFAIAAEARRVGLPFAGHIPLAITPAEASDAGQRSLEHLTRMDLPCAPGEAEAFAKRWRRHTVLGRCAEEDQVPLYARFVRNGTWITPTLIVLRGWALMGDSTAPPISGLKYVSPAQHALWDLAVTVPDSIPDNASVIGRRLFRRRLDLVRALYRAGVPLLAGSDAPARLVPGLSLHDELALLVEAGLKPLDALRAATLNPARYFDALDSLGTVEPGKRADLVLLDANPLADIRNTTKIRAVVANGRYLDRAALDALLADVERAAHAAAPAP